jgi:hypothetical protein
MKRRELITLISLVLAGVPLAAQAEPIRQLGVLMSTKQDDPVAQSRVAAPRTRRAAFAYAFTSLA